MRDLSFEPRFDVWRAYDDDMPVHITDGSQGFLRTMFPEAIADLEDCDDTGQLFVEEYSDGRETNLYFDHDTPSQSMRWDRMLGEWVPSDDQGDPDSANVESIGGEGSST